MCGFPSPKKYAVITMVSTPEYAVGANVLLYSIKKHMKPSILPLVGFYVLLIKEHTNNEEILEQLKGWTPCFVNLIRPPYEDAVTFFRFKEQFTKLIVWNMTQFERVVYLDSDTLSIGDISELLINQRKSSFIAVKDWENNGIKEHFNMGVFSITPSISYFQWLDEMRKSKRDYRMQMAEQGLLNSLIGQNYEEYPFVYNGNLAAAVQNRSFWDSHVNDIRIIHYTWIKPFESNHDKHVDYHKCSDVMKLWWKYHANLY